MRLFLGNEKGRARLPVSLDLLPIEADVEVLELFDQPGGQHVIHTGVQPCVQSFRGRAKKKVKMEKKTTKTHAYGPPCSFAIHSNDGTKESSEIQSEILTVHFGMQPEDAGVGVSKGTAQPAAALLPPLLLQPLTVWDARLLVHLEAPDKHEASVPAVKTFGFGSLLTEQ